MLAALALPVPLETAGGAVTLRRADVEDLGALMRLLADDAISASRGDQADESDTAAYRAGLVETLADASNDLVVAVGPDGVVIAMMQLTRIPGLSRRGATRLLVEAVRVSSARRSSGIGSALMRWTTDVAAPALGAALVQLTSDEARTDAHRFYERLGFVGSHRGFKYAVREPADAL